MTRRAALLACCLLALAGAGCGAGAGDAPDEVRLTVTDRFGQRTLLEKVGPDVRGGDTVMRLLQRNAKVRTRYGGGFVAAIDGLAGGRENGRPVDWFYFVNGVLADRGAAAVEVRKGSRIWWDRRDWGAAMTVPAVVGSFPEPFVNGFADEPGPTRLECDDAAQSACDGVQRRLLDLGLVVAKSRAGTDAAGESLRIIVGLWPAIRGDRALFGLERGPKSSGVYARLSRDGRRLTALDARGRAARELGAGTGLVAATRYRDQPPTWVVTGTDEAGLLAAARALDERALDDKFALAVAGGRGIALPLQEDAR